MATVDCSGCGRAVDEQARFCPRCGGAVTSSAPPAIPLLGPAVNGRRARWPFWVFVAAMLVAVAGGAAVVWMVKRTSAERRNFARDPDRRVTAPTQPQRPPPP